MMSNRIFLIISFSVLFIGKSFAQSDWSPEVGKVMPGFVLNELTHYDQTQVKLQQLKGRWFALDFWSTWCVSCFKSFPKINSIQAQFRDRLTWILIGRTKLKSGEISDIDFYEKMRKKRNLNIPAAYDSVLAKKWNVSTLPHIIIVDPEGVVRFITDGRDLTLEKVRDMLDGKRVEFYPKKSRLEKPIFDPVNMDSMVGENILFRSSVSKWQGESSSSVDIERWVKWPVEELRKGWLLTGVPLFVLYNYAYTGKYKISFKDSLYGLFYPNPVLQLKDSSSFLYSFGSEGRGVYGLYNYSLNMPSEKYSAFTIMKCMREDLGRSFNYDVTIEKREVPVFKLIAIESGAIDKIKSKGGKQYETPGSQAMGYRLVNYPKEYLIGTLMFYIKDQYQREVFIDETGNRSNIDFSIDADMTDLNDIRRQLRKQGFDIVSGTKEMNCIVIR